MGSGGLSGERIACLRKRPTPPVVLREARRPEPAGATWRTSVAMIKTIPQQADNIQ